MGLHASFRESLYLWAHRGLLVRSLLAMYVAVPLLAIALAVMFDLPRGTELAMIILAICAGAPLLPRKVMKLGGDPDFGISLAFMTSLLAIVTVPLSLRALGGVMELESGLGPGEVASAILWSFLLPFSAGMGVRAVAPALATRLSDPLLSVAGAVLMIGTLLKVAFGWRILLGIGAPTLMAFAAFVAGSLAIGHLFGGPVPGNRAALAVASTTRHVGLALLIGTNLRSTAPLSLVAAYVVATALVSIPYIRWQRARLASGAPA
jgi:BASS family bile acid:Na+ symporter